MNHIEAHNIQHSITHSLMHQNHKEQQLHTIMQLKQNIIKHELLNYFHSYMLFLTNLNLEELPSPNLGILIISSKV